MLAKVFGVFLSYAAIILPLVIAILLIVWPAFRSGTRLVLRVLARPLLLVAIVALVWDGTRTLAGEGWVWTSLAEHWQALAPRSLNALQSTVTRVVHPRAWDGGVLRVLTLPAWLVLGVLAIMLGWIGRKRQQVDVFAN
jgi:hypothetical protein